MKWIDVLEDLPSLGEWVFVRFGKRDIATARYITKFKHWQMRDYSWSIKKVKHWMEIPDQLLQGAEIEYEPRERTNQGQEMP